MESWFSQLSPDVFQRIPFALRKGYNKWRLDPTAILPLYLVGVKGLPGPPPCLNVWTASKP